jgi:exopolysaccharide production protein ExoZ
MPDPASKSGADKHLLGVQYLRAIAALMVAYFHASIQIPASRPDFDRYLFGWLNLASGVDIFFVISGFIMLVSSRNSTPGQFAVRRVVRIVPLYWLLTVLLVALAVLLPGLFHTTAVSFEAIAKSFLFIPYPNPAHGGELYPLLLPGWTLNLEMFFYVIFALALFAAARFRLWIVGAVLGALVLWGLMTSGAGVPRELLFYTDIRLIEFWLGMLIAHCVMRGWVHMPRLVAAALVVLGFMVLLTGFPITSFEVSHPVHDLTIQVLPAAAIVLGTLVLERAGVIGSYKWLHWLGDASYSIYLTHIFSLGIARVIWHAIGLERSGIVYLAGFAVFGMVLVVAGAGLAYATVEKPVTDALQKLLKRQRSGRIDPVADARSATLSTTAPGKPH